MKEETIELTTKEPFEKIYINICGPLPKSERKRYVFAIIDRFSRYISLTAIAKQDEETVIKTIREKWILKFGAPKEIYTD